MLIEIITLFPESVQQMLGVSIPLRAQQYGAVEIETVQLRDFAGDRHGKVDDKPFGGGPGMVIKPDVLARALRELRRKRPEPAPYVVFTSPKGQRLTQGLVEKLAKLYRLTIICGHYKGVDQRAIDQFVDLSVSIGDYVLSGGEAPAVVISDAVIRLLPGVLGDPESAAGDSFSSGLLDFPHYTQPADWEGNPVPEVLLSGHHKRIAGWRLEQSIEETKRTGRICMKTG